MATVGIKGLTFRTWRRCCFNAMRELPILRHLRLKQFYGVKRTKNINIGIALMFYYRAMHFSAKRGLAIAFRLSVRPSVTLVDCDHIAWNSSEIISPLVSLGCSLSADPNIRGSIPRGIPGHFDPE